VNDLDRLAALLAEREETVRALLPEEGRLERLRGETATLEARYPDPAARPPLFGVPVGVKDVFHVDGFPTRAGSRLPPEVLAGPEAASVTALKSAGALILGKTVSTEFAYLAPGPTSNPRDPERTPGGSSSGSAAAVAAGYCPLALGTQTIGSIIRPAAYCGVVGFKPSYDRVSRDGVIPLAPSLDHVGLLAASVSWAERAAGVLCRYWQPPGRGLSARNPKKPGLPVLAIPEGPYLARATDDFRAAAERLAAAGYEVRQVAAMPDFAAIETRHRRLVAAEAARVHADWLDRFRDLYAPETLALILAGQKVTEEEQADDLLGRERLRAELTALMDQHGLDLWIAPSAPGPAPRGLESTGDPVMNLPWTHAGLPSLGLPVGSLSANSDAEGLPVGLQVIGRWYADESLLAWGRGMEGVYRLYS
jgi:Asp-tRNA(Asn)/Glu-tRNA(Gln) amidotransferase A subunit family amidase